MSIDDYDDYDNWEVKQHARLSKKRIGSIVPAVTIMTRVRDESVGGPNPFRWEEVTSYDYFGGKRVIVFSLPGAFIKRTNSPSWFCVQTDFLSWFRLLAITQFAASTIVLVER